MRNSFSDSDAKRLTHVDIWDSEDTSLSEVAHDMGGDFSMLSEQALRARSMNKKIIFMI